MIVIDLIETLSRPPETTADLARLVVQSVACTTEGATEVIVQPYSGQDVALVRVSVRGQPIVRLVSLREAGAKCGELAADAALLLARLEHSSRCAS